MTQVVVSNSALTEMPGRLNNIHMCINRKTHSPHGRWSGGPSSAWQGYLGDVTTCPQSITYGPSNNRCSSAFSVWGTAVPEPGPLALLGAGLMGAFRRKRSKRA